VDRSTNIVRHLEQVFESYLMMFRELEGREKQQLPSK
jgi:hypothetical protein